MIYMNIPSKLKPLISKLKLRLRLISSIALSVALLYFLFFLFQNLYQPIISPKLIDPNVVITKKQKVNLSLFDSIENNIAKKILVDDQTLSTLKNPFE